MSQQYEYQYLYVEDQIPPKFLKKEESFLEEKRIEIIQVFGEEEEI
jgi:hypothetical protein